MSKTKKEHSLMVELLIKIKDVFKKPAVLLSGGISIPFGEITDILLKTTISKWYLVLLIVNMLDWITGTKAARKDGIHTSDYGRTGLSRTVVVLSLPVLAIVLDRIVGENHLIFYYITGGLIVNTWLSFTANVARAGWDKIIPIQVLNFVADEIKAKTLRAQQRKDSLGITETNNGNEDTPAS